MLKLEWNTNKSSKVQPSKEMIICQIKKKTDMHNVKKLIKATNSRLNMLPFLFELDWTWYQIKCVYISPSQVA
jgi:hypothetical protein